MDQDSDHDVDDADDSDSSYVDINEKRIRVDDKEPAGAPPKKKKKND